MNDAVATLEQVLDQLPDAEHALRARVLTTLAIELYYSPTDQRGGALARQGVALARVHGDEALLVETLHLQHLADWRPDRLAERLAASQELLELTARPELASYSPVVHFIRACDLFAAGEEAQSRAHLARAHALAAQHQARMVLQLVRWAEATFLLVDGDLEAAEAATMAAYREHSRTSLWGAEEVLAAQLFMLRRAGGRLAELEAHLAALIPFTRHAAVRDMHALALVAAGRVDDARSQIGPWSEQRVLLFNHSWLSSMLARLELWAALDDDEAVAQLTAELAPYSAQVAMVGSLLGSFGPVDQAIEQVLGARAVSRSGGSSRR